MGCIELLEEGQELEWSKRAAHNPDDITLTRAVSTTVYATMGRYRVLVDKYISTAIQTVFTAVVSFLFGSGSWAWVGIQQRGV